MAACPTSDRDPRNLRCDRRPTRPRVLRSGRSYLKADELRVVVVAAVVVVVQVEQIVAMMEAEQWKWRGRVEWSVGRVPEELCFVEALQRWREC